MTIRRARPGDAAELAVIHVESWQEAYRDDFSHDYLSGLDLEWRERWFETRIEEGGELLVAVADGVQVGFCTFGASSEGGWGEVFAIYAVSYTHLTLPTIYSV